MPKNKPKKVSSKPSAPGDSAVTKMVTGIFGKIQAKTGLSNEKIDQFQKSWLAMPATRKKYEHLTDAPMVAIEEGMAMANDILDYLQRQEGGKSLMFQKLKEQTSELVHHPVEFFKSKVEKAEALWQGFMGKAKEAQEKAKAAGDQVKAKAKVSKKKK